MAKEKKVKEKKVLEGLAKFNRVSKPVNFIFSIIFIIAAFYCGNWLFVYPAEMVAGIL